jgi:hypothetical protein
MLPPLDSKGQIVKVINYSTRIACLSDIEKRKRTPAPAEGEAGTPFEL